MRNFVLSLVAIFIMSSFVATDKTNDIGGKFLIKKSLNTEKVDSFEIVSDEGNFNELYQRCSVTINYYYQGTYVGQQTYSGNTSTLCGVKTCGQWRDTMVGAIRSHVKDTETMYPSCNDCGC